MNQRISLTRAQVLLTVGQTMATGVVLDADDEMLRQQILDGSLLR